MNPHSFDAASRPPLLERLPRAPRKVALLRASRIGDFLCAIPALRALRARLPEAEISMITLPLLEEIAARSPYIDRVLAFPGFPGIADQFFEACSTVRFLRQMQEEEFDLAIQMQGTGVYSNPFVLLLGARAAAGFVRPGDGPGLLDAALPYPHGVHEIHCVQALTTFLGAPPQGEDVEFPLWPADREAADSLLSGLPQPWIGLHPSSRDQPRRWPLERFASLGSALLETRTLS
jgi:ADP-heptose:LPS heptosyltransferase